MIADFGSGASFSLSRNYDSALYALYGLTDVSFNVPEVWRWVDQESRWETIFLFAEVGLPDASE